jgi:hypothetical protein
MMARVAWQATTEHTIPASSSLVAGAKEQRTLDTTIYLGDGQTPVAPSVQLMRLDTFTLVENGAVLSDPPITGNIISFAVSGVERDTTYELRVGFDHTPPRVVGERTIALHIIEGVA